MSSALVIWCATRAIHRLGGGFLAGPGEGWPRSATSPGGGCRSSARRARARGRTRSALPVPNAPTIVPRRAVGPGRGRAPRQHAGWGTRKAGRADLLDGLLTCTCGRRLRSDGTFADGRHRRLHPSPCKAWGPRARYGDEIWALQSGLPAQPWTGHSVSQWRFAVLGRTPTRAAAQETEPPAATNAARTSTWRAVGVLGSDPRR